MATADRRRSLVLGLDYCPAGPLDSSAGQEESQDSRQPAAGGRQQHAVAVLLWDALLLDGDGCCSPSAHGCCGPCCSFSCDVTNRSSDRQMRGQLVFCKIRQRTCNIKGMALHKKLQNLDLCKFMDLLFLVILSRQSMPIRVSCF